MSSPTESSAPKPSGPTVQEALRTDSGLNRNVFAFYREKMEVTYKTQRNMLIGLVVFLFASVVMALVAVIYTHMTRSAVKKTRTSICGELEEPDKASCESEFEELFKTSKKSTPLGWIAFALGIVALCLLIWLFLRVRKMRSAMHNTPVAEIKAK